MRYTARATKPSHRRKGLGIPPDCCFSRTIPQRRPLGRKGNTIAARILPADRTKCRTVTPRAADFAIQPLRKISSAQVLENPQR